MVGRVAIRTTPASSRHRAPAERKFTQCKYTPATVISAPITHSISRRSEIRRVERAFAICMVRFSEEVFASANRFVSENNNKANAPQCHSQNNLIKQIRTETLQTKPATTTTAASKDL